MQSFRLPRFKRAPTVAPFQLTHRDNEILRMIHRHRFLRSNHIVALIGGSPQQLSRRLQLLYHHGYLERPRAQLDYYHKGGSRHIVYGLDTKGRNLFEKEIGVFRPASWGRNNRAVGRMFLEHALLVSDVMMAIDLACRKNGWIRLIYEEHLQPKPFQWKVNVGGAKLGVVPDRTFALDYQDQTGQRERAYFFLEADRGTMPVTRKTLRQTSFYRKLLAFEATWSQSIHRSRFQFHRFQVLTVTTNAERVRSLVRACSRLKSGHGLFLFTDRASFENADDIFSVVWHTGRQGETGTLLR